MKMNIDKIVLKDNYWGLVGPNNGIGHGHPSKLRSLLWVSICLCTPPLHKHGENLTKQSGAARDCAAGGGPWILLLLSAATRKVLPTPKQEKTDRPGWT